MGKKTMTSKDSISKLNAYKQAMMHVSDGLPVREFSPLRSWPSGRHPRQSDLDAFASLPSQYNQGGK